MSEPTWTLGREPKNAGSPAATPVSGLGLSRLRSIRLRGRSAAGSVAAELISAAICVILVLIVVPGSVEAQDRQATAVVDGSARPAYHLEAGSLARSRLVVLGQDLLLEGEAQSDAVVISGSVQISGHLERDLIVLDGDVRLTSTAEVGGDVYVLGGRVDVASGAVVGGRSVAYPEASDLWVTLIEGPALGLAPSSRLVIGAKLALLAFWIFVVLALLAVARRQVVSTSESVQVEPFYNFFVGLTGVAAMLLTALFFNAFTGALLGVPLLVLVGVVALGLRFWGMVAVFHALGTFLHRRFGRRPPVPLIAATWGLVVLGLLKMVPFIGIWTWSMATFIGVGAALSTKLGRREPWFEEA